MEPPEEATAEPQGILASVGRYWRQSLLLIVATTLLALVGSLLWPERWTARVELGITDPRGSSVFARPGTFPQEYERYTERQAELVESGPVYNAVRARIPGLTSEAYLRDVEAKTDVIGLIVVDVQGSSASAVVALGEAVADGYAEATTGITEDRAERTRAAFDETRQDILADIADAQRDVGGEASPENVARRVAFLTDSLALLDRRATEVTVDARSFGDGLDFVDPPRRPSRPVEPQPVRNVAVGALVGLLLAATGAWVKGGRDAEDTDETTELLLGAPRLGIVPELVPGSPDQGAGDGAFDAIASALEQEVPSGIVLVTAATRRSGTTTTSVHLAAALARRGRRVVVVDADVRTAGATRLLLGPAGARGQGLADAARGLAEVGETVRAVSVGDVALRLVPRGSAVMNPSALLRSRRTAAVLTQLRDAHDLVVVDCPALPTADVVAMAATGDALVLVTGPSSSVASLQEVAQLLEVLPTPVAGYVTVPHRATSVPRTGRRGAAAALPRPRRVARSGGRRSLRR